MYGEVWEKEIKNQLHKADIVLLLVSAYTLATDYFYDREMTKTLERHNNNETTVIPIILKECVWGLTPLNKLQVLPLNGKPINTWENETDAYTNIVHELVKRLDIIIDKKQEIKERQEAKDKLEAIKHQKGMSLV